MDYMICNDINRFYPKVKGCIIDSIAVVAENKLKDIDKILVLKSYQYMYFTTYFKTNLKKVYDIITKSVN